MFLRKGITLFRAVPLTTFLYQLPFLLHDIMKTKSIRFFYFYFLIKSVEPLSCTATCFRLKSPVSLSVQFGSSQHGVKVSHWSTREELTAFSQLMVSVHGWLHPSVSRCGCQVPRSLGFSLSPSAPTACGGGSGTQGRAVALVKWAL